MSIEGTGKVRAHVRVEHSGAAFGGSELCYIFDVLVSRGRRN